MAGTPVLERALTEGAREEAAARLRKIEGQVRGLLNMLETGRHGVELLMQLSSVQEALRGVGKVVLQSHLEDFATTGAGKGGRQVEQAHREILDLMYKYVR